MYKDYRYINAGENEIYRYGHKAQEKVATFLKANEQGFYSIPADGGKYYTIGTSNGRYGEFAKYGDTFLPVNSAGNVWAKTGSAKEETFIAMVNGMIQSMIQKNQERIDDLTRKDEEEE